MGMNVSIAVLFQSVPNTVSMEFACSLCVCVGLLPESKDMQIKFANLPLTCGCVCCISRMPSTLSRTGPLLEEP